jgi:HEAT repeat protein
MIQISLLALSALLLQGPSLDSSSPKERMAAVDQVARPGNDEAIPALAATLKKEPKSNVREEILAALVRIGGPSVPPILAMSLNSDLDRDVRLQAIDSIVGLYATAEQNGPIQTLFNRVKSVVGESDRPSVASGARVDKTSKDALSAAMQKDAVEEVRSAAARALGTLLAKDYVPVMLSTLGEPQNQEYRSVRLEIIESLGVIRDPAAGPALQKTLKDKDSEIVKQSIVAIGLIGFSPARADLENIFRNDSHRELKEQAVESLAMLRDPAGKPLFESLLSSPNDFYREKAAEGLARTDYDAAGFADALKTEKKAGVRLAMTFALVSSNHNDYINDLTNALATRQSDQAETYVYELGKFKGKVPLLNGYLRSSDPKVRARVARILGRIGDPSSRAPIEELRKDPDADVIREAANALRQMNAQ